MGRWRRPLRETVWPEDSSIVNLDLCMRNANVGMLHSCCRIDLLRSSGSVYKLAGAASRSRGQSSLQDNGRREWRGRKAANAEGADNPNGRGSTWDSSPRMTGHHEQLWRGGCPLTPYKPKRLALNRPKRMIAIVCSLEGRRRSNLSAGNRSLRPRAAPTGAKPHSPPAGQQR
jgi:hypothetical protein